MHLFPIVLKRRVPKIMHNLGGHIAEGPKNKEEKEKRTKSTTKALSTQS